MQVDIQSTGFTLTDGILMKRLADDLGRSDDHVTRAIVCGNVSPWNYDAKIE